MSRADAFVLTHAFAGVMRAMGANADHPLQKEEVEDALTRLIVNFVRATTQRTNVTP